MEHTADILVVDDEADMVNIICLFLSTFGLTTESCQDATEALRKLKAGNFRMLITDNMMPGLTGLELCQQIRAHPELSTLPLLMISAKQLTEEERILMMRLHIHHLKKPVKGQVLAEKVKEILAHG